MKKTPQNLEELRVLQALPFDKKLNYTKERIKEYYDYFNGNVYVSFSGGKDSTLLLHIARSLYPDMRAVFCNTGAEYPEILQFVKQTPNVIWLQPKMSYQEVIKKYGYPVTNKEQARYLHEYRETKSERLRNIRWSGDHRGRNKIADRWKVLRYAPFKVSHKCCERLKLSPFAAFHRKTGLRPYTGIRASEGQSRLLTVLQYGCNRYQGNPSSRPLAIWNDQDIAKYIEDYKVEVSSIYAMGYERTGCMFCMFGVHRESYPNRFQRMKQTHPELYTYCMEDLGLKNVLDFIGIDFE